MRAGLLGLNHRLVGRWTVMVAPLGIGVYAVFVGAEAAVLRAALMGGLVVSAAGMGRRSTVLISLAMQVTTRRVDYGRHRGRFRC